MIESLGDNGHNVMNLLSFRKCGAYLFPTVEVTERRMKTELSMNNCSPQNADYSSLNLCRMNLTNIESKSGY